MTELERAAAALNKLGYLQLSGEHRCFQLLDVDDYTILWVPVRLWTEPMHDAKDVGAEWYHPTLWLADNDLTGDELRAGKGMYFEDPIVAAVWLKTEASVKP